MSVKGAAILINILNAKKKRDFCAHDFFKLFELK